MVPTYGWSQIESDRAGEKQLLDRHGYPPDHPAHLFFRTVVPRVYSSMDELEEWRQHFSYCVAEIESCSFTPEQGLQALRFLNTFAVAYQQRNDRQLFARLYRAIVDKIHRRFMPEFSEPLPRRRKRKRLRVGYISENLKFSNGALWAIGWMKNHGPDIESYALSLSVEQDSSTPLYRRAVDHYFSLGKGYRADVETIKSLDLDVLIYTDIGMGSTISYFAGLRLAPVQCTAWGHPVTSGFPTIDYYLSSELMEPPEGDEQYSEQLIRLPGIGVCFSSREPDISRLSKADLGLDEGPMYLSCQSVMKYLPRYDEVFVRINEATGRPIVFTPGSSEVLTTAMKSRMERAGVNGVWLPSLSTADFFRVQQLADVSIDSIGWSGGNTSVDALSFGVPVVTLPGDSMRSRHSTAFLQLGGGDGLIATDIDDFVALATNADRRTEAMRGFDSQALFDETRPVKALDEWMLSLFETKMATGP